jgi:hypothetical protein
MAVLVIADSPGTTVEQYEAVSRAIGFRDPDFEVPAGLISHTAGIDDEGVLIVDVWESAEDFERLMQQAVPAMQEVGVPPMEPRILPVHNRIDHGRGTHPGVLLLIESDAFTPETYDELTSRMPAHEGDGSNHPAVSHAAGVTDDGMVFVDVWDSPESFGRFAEEQLGPAAGDAELPPMEPRFVPVHYRLEGKS